jgi:hypothetical protein
LLLSGVVNNARDGDKTNENSEHDQAPGICLPSKAFADVGPRGITNPPKMHGR